MRYFVRNSAACDSVEGLVRWQLLEEAIVERMQATEAALRDLVARGYLIERLRPGMAAVYHLNLERQAAALELLERAVPASSREEP